MREPRSGPVCHDVLVSRRAFPALALASLLLALSCSAQAPASPSSTTASPSPPASVSPSVSPTATPSAVVSPTILPTTVPLPSFARVSAPSGSVVWVLVGGVLLFRSTDRGDTWQARPLPPGLPNLEISFVDDHEGWLSTVGTPATQCQSQSIALWHTADAGKTWERLSVTGIADARCKGQLSFTDRTHGFLVASDPQRAPAIYRTADGGRTWSASPPIPDPPGVTTSPPAGPTLQAGRVRAFGSTLLAPVEGPGGGASAVYYVFSSSDGGASWLYAAKAPSADGPLALVTASRWLLIAPPAQSQETTDAGKTWHAYRTDYSQAAPIRPDIVFGDPNLGYATVRGSLQRTVDGGAHWTTIKTPGTG